MQDKETPDTEVPVLPIEEWACAGVAAMLQRVRSVCITEYQWMIDELLEQ